jgi:hypothetical protein
MPNDAGPPPDAAGETPSGGRPPATVRTFLRYSLVVIAVVALYVGWTFYSRWQQNRAIDRRIEQERAAKRRAEARQIVQQLGGSTLAILNFYADPPTLARGETADLCYGVSNAKAVRLKPPSGRVWPSEARCLQVAPKKTTTYTLTAVDAAGHAKTATITVQVRR